MISKENRLRIYLFLMSWTFLFVFFVYHDASAQYSESPLKELEGVGVTEKLNAQIPLHLEFRNEQDRSVRLQDYFTDKRPVLLILAYYRCPMLCTLVINGAVDALKQIPLTPGKDYEIVTVSIDPLETPTLAKFKKQNYLKEFGKPEAAHSWHFLTGREDNIKQLADAVGFGYRYNEEREEYSHPAVLTIGAPDGRVSRYLYGIQFEPQTMRLSFVEASEGKIGSTLDRILLFCFHYDSAAGRYAPIAMNIMRLAGGITVLALAASIFILYRRGSIPQQNQTIEGSTS
ncbi:MAG: SCO family protein [Candidatus Omnitrophota bacterium]|nr:MAG: SCO family protein [Candidatus Omnitrophota bacterium]